MLKFQVLSKLMTVLVNIKSRVMGNWEPSFIGLTGGLVTKDDDGKTASYVRGKKVQKSGGMKYSSFLNFNCFAILTLREKEKCFCL